MFKGVTARLLRNSRDVHRDDLTANPTRHLTLFVSCSSITLTIILEIVHIYTWSIIVSNIDVKGLK